MVSQKPDVKHVDNFEIRVKEVISTFGQMEIVEVKTLVKTDTLAEMVAALSCPNLFMQSLPKAWKSPSRQSKLKQKSPSPFLRRRSLTSGLRRQDHGVKPLDRRKSSKVSSETWRLEP